MPGNGRDDLADGCSLIVTADLEHGRHRPTWTVDVTSVADDTVVGENEFGDSVVLDLAAGGVVLWIAGGALRGRIEDWRPCRPEEPAAAEIRRRMEERTYWRARTARESPWP
ncbi:hypothetical protein [Amycolatopsis sp. NPDC004079]|uniref:hypothetical protein n=1 Tax=Amycolatopsis sp. NPDC004079 TaxID=3154549 RepID=UPI0033A886ED